MITTEGMHAQTYGYFEMRAKLPEGKGLWPAFWLLPTAPTWPPEIDALEGFGGTNSRGEGGASSYHWGEISSQAGASNGDWVTVPGVNFYQEFHTFGVDWQPDYITYYLDGQQVGRVATPSDMHQQM